MTNVTNEEIIYCTKRITHGVRFVQIKYNEITSKIYRLWWNLVPGKVVKVKWPYPTILAAGFTEHYRPWLEKNVGKQHIDWDWAILDGDMRNDQLSIKLRLGKTKWASIIALKWS